MPRVLWIELTSRCPYDCPFCSRRVLRGHGEHMPFERFAQIIGELDRPEIIRLNYSGESSHYPRIVDAIALAAAKGAWIELVSVPAAVPPQRLEAMVRAGLNRLTISLHTLDATRYHSIYRFGTLERLVDSVRATAALRATAAHPFIVDLAFVAMQRNLDELAAVTALADELAIPVVAVHPVIRRTEIPESFADELDEDGRLRNDFARSIDAMVERVRAAHPRVAIQISAPTATDPTPSSGHGPEYRPFTLAAGELIHGCDQDPFETIHVLADGTVTSCEVRDTVPMGRVGAVSLREIWHGSAFAAFRSAHALGADAACRNCTYKRVHRPAPLETRITPTRAVAQLLRGWHVPEPTLVWSKRDALLVLARAAGARMVSVRALLPPGPGQTNRLTLRADDGATITADNATSAPALVEIRLALPATAGPSPGVHIHCDVAHAYRPASAGAADARELGFALMEAEIR